MKKLVKQFIERERGQAMLHFSLVAMILLLLTGGVIDAVIIMRYHIALSGAATEIANKITVNKANGSDINTIGNAVININYQNILGDGDTVFTADIGDMADDVIVYSYHDYPDGKWNGYRRYIPVTIVLERELTLFTPVGQMIFSNAGDHRLIRGVAQRRVYMN